MSTQSNPIIFVSLGQGAEIWQHLSNALKKYTNGIAYIDVQERFDERWVKREIGRVWKEFLQQGQNSADLVRVNFIISTDEAGPMLPDLYKYTEKYLSALYPAGILADVYCVLDDDRLLENEDNRRLVMLMLKREQRDGLNVYLLSNLTSQNVLIPNESIGHTIAMLTLFKDCVPDLYVTGADASRYNELYFLDNCYAKQGQFLTASSLNVTIPLDGLKAVLMTELLSFGKDNPVEAGNILDENIFFLTRVRQVPAKSMEYLLGMAIPAVNVSSHYTRRQWIEKLFGKRLELLADTNKKPKIEAQSDSLPKFNALEVNLYDLIRLTSEDGVFEYYAAAALENAQNNLDTSTEKLHSWLDTPPSFIKGSPEAEKRRLSPFISQDLWPYVIASDYLNGLAKIQYWNDVIEIMEKRCEYVVDVHHELLRFLDQVNTKISEYTNKSQIINDTFAPFSPNATDYFRNLFKEFSIANHEGIADLSRQMIKAFVEDDFHGYLKKLDEYIDNYILTSRFFDKPIMDTLNDIVTIHGHSDIPTALGEWVFNHRRWNIRLKTGYANLHTEINLFMPTQGAADVKHRYEERGFGRMNLFTDENANHVAVLYHAGAFDLEDLFYGSLYIDNYGEDE
ncbi:MAG: hypothetical protein FWC32_12770 [Firmicutes bacterium]|nr:hypothetical protein [Bacillota bacterium]